MGKVPLRPLDIIDLYTNLYYFNEAFQAIIAYIANNMDPDQTAPREQSDQVSYC